MPNSTPIPQIDRRGPECVALDNRSATATRFSAAICLLLVVFCAINWPAAAQDRTYNAPRHNDLRLDWCLTWGTDCGRPAAVAYCNRRRYADVVVFRAEVVGRSEPTSLIGTNEVCSGHDFCTAFAYITCAAPIPRDHVFANPEWDGHRLDFCREWGTNCGQPAADAFCQALGFPGALHAAADRDPGYSSTRVISSGQVCDQPFCRGFQQIICH
jgi:hypothetical protein